MGNNCVIRRNYFCCTFFMRTITFWNYVVEGTEKVVFSVESIYLMVWNLNFRLDCFVVLKRFRK